MAGHFWLPRTSSIQEKAATAAEKPQVVTVSATT
jgi:hypothetical protein